MHSLEINNSLKFPKHLNDSEIELDIHIYIYNI